MRPGRRGLLGLAAAAVMVLVAVFARRFFVSSATPVSQTEIPFGSRPPDTPPAALSAQTGAAPESDEARKLETLKAILAGKNDNDPRLDTDFRNLTPSMKKELRGYYDSLAPEMLNQRGTIVFLLGREIGDRADAAFMVSVLHEPVCRSFAHCSAPAHAPADQDDDTSQSVTLAYPQLMALRGVGLTLPRNADLFNSTDLNRSMQALTTSDNSALARAASRFKLAP